MTISNNFSLFSLSHDTLVKHANYAEYNQLAFLGAQYHPLTSPITSLSKKNTAPTFLATWTRRIDEQIISRIFSVYNGIVSTLEHVVSLSLSSIEIFLGGLLTLTPSAMKHAIKPLLFSLLYLLGSLLISTIGLLAPQFAVRIYNVLSYSLKLKENRYDECSLALQNSYQHAPILGFMSLIRGLRQSLDAIKNFAYVLLMLPFSDNRRNIGYKLCQCFVGIWKNLIYGLIAIFSKEYSKALGLTQTESKKR